MTAETSSMLWWAGMRLTWLYIARPNTMPSAQTTRPMYSNVRPETGVPNTEEEVSSTGILRSSSLAWAWRGSRRAARAASTGLHRPGPGVRGRTAAGRDILIEYSFYVWGSRHRGRGGP